MGYSHANRFENDACSHGRSARSILHSLSILPKKCKSRMGWLYMRYTGVSWPWHPHAATAALNTRNEEGAFV